MALPPSGEWSGSSTDRQIVNMQICLNPVYAYNKSFGPNLIGCRIIGGYELFGLRIAVSSRELREEDNEVEIL